MAHYRVQVTDEKRCLRQFTDRRQTETNDAIKVAQGKAIRAGRAVNVSHG